MTKDRKPLITLLSVTLIAFVLVGFTGFHYTKQSIIASKKQDVETMLTIASKQSSAYIDQYKQGLLTKKETDEKIIHFLSALQFESAYIWANDNFGIARVHAREAIIGQFQQSYVENMAALANQKMYYRTQPNIKPVLNERVLKTNGITKIPEWDWVIGYGLYIDDVNTIAFNAQLPFIMLLVGLMTFITFLALFLMRRTHDA